MQQGSKFTCDMPPDASLVMFLVEGLGHYDAREGAIVECLSNLNQCREGLTPEEGK